MANLEPNLLMKTKVCSILYSGGRQHVLTEMVSFVPSCAMMESPTPLPPAIRTWTHPWIVCIFVVCHDPTLA